MKETTPDLRKDGGRWGAMEGGWWIIHSKLKWIISHGRRDDGAWCGNQGCNSRGRATVSVGRSHPDRRGCVRKVGYKMPAVLPALPVLVGGERTRKS